MPARLARDDTFASFSDKLRVADTDPVRRWIVAGAAMQAVLKHPCEVIPMNDAPDERLLWVEVAVVVSH